MVHGANLKSGAFGVKCRDFGSGHTGDILVARIMFRMEGSSTL